MLVEVGMHVMQDGKAPPRTLSTPEPAAEVVQQLGEWAHDSQTSATAAERHLQHASVSTEELQAEARSGAEHRRSLCIAPQEASDVIQAASQPHGSPLPCAHLLPCQLLPMNSSQLFAAPPHPWQSELPLWFTLWGGCSCDLLACTAFEPFIKWQSTRRPASNSIDQHQVCEPIHSNVTAKEWDGFE